MKFEIKTDSFSGPIGVLHSMIEERKLSISQFSLASVTEDFIAYVRSLEGIDREETTHFVQVAAILILLKSKSLLPDLELSIEEDRDIEILSNQLECFAILKERQVLVRKLWNKNIILSGKVKSIDLGPIFVPDQRLDINYFYAYLKIRLEELVPQEEVKKVAHVYKTLKIEDALSHVREIIKRIKNLNFKNLNDSGDERLRERNKRNVVILFLAVLELVKVGEIDVVQDENFSDIIVLDTSSQEV